MEQIHRVHVNGSTHSRSPDIEHLQILVQPLKPFNIPPDHGGIGLKGLAQADGDRVLQLGAANLDHIVKLHGFLL